MNIGKFRHKGLKRLSQVETVPGWNLHPLKGGRKAEYSITVTGNWRLTFTVEGSVVTDVNFEDYH